MSDIEDDIPTAGKRVRVWDYLIQQAADHLALTKADYVTLVVVGNTCVSVHTGKSPRPKLITHQVEMLEEPERKAGSGRPSTKARQPKQVRKVRKSPQWRVVDAMKVLEIYQADQKTPYSAKEIGDILGFERKDQPSRGALSRLLAEFRLSGIVRPTSDTRMPEYIYVDKLPQVKDPEISEHGVLRAMREAKRPVAFGVLCDILGISRADRQNRTHLVYLVQDLVETGKLERVVTDISKISVYSLPGG